MNETTIQDIERNLQTKSTEELLAIWQAENREDYSDEGFEAVRRLLSSRGNAFPPKTASAEIEKNVKKYPAGPRGKDYVCTACYVAFTQESALSRSFLGFGRFDCPKCGKTIRYPLTVGYKIFYWFFVVAVAIFCVMMFRQGNVVIPGLAWIAALVALGNDGYFKKRVKTAWYEHERKGKPRAELPPISDTERIASLDPIRWFHVVFAILMPCVAIPWGIINLVRKKRRSGILLIVIPVITIVLLAMIILITTRGK
jgi:hypothetical protein